jgi:hypothetical protein
LIFRVCEWLPSVLVFVVPAIVKPAPPKPDRAHEEVAVVNCGVIVCA